MTTSATFEVRLDHPQTKPLDQLCIDTIRTIAMDGVQKANSGHPGAPMGLAPVVYWLWEKFLRHNPENPQWPNRDRFVLSGGHASMLLYSLLHLTGYDLPMSELERFRQLGSRTPGHPEYRLTAGVETTTGPLGQGFTNSVGMAIAERWLAERFNRDGHEIVNYRTYAIGGDGDMMEGICSEAASLAAHLGLHKLLWFYDNNKITIEGKTSLAFSEDVAARFKAYGWFVQHVTDANDLKAINRAIKRAIKQTEKPSFIVVDSHIAYGAPTKQDTAGAHGEPLGEEEIRQTKERYGWPPDAKFFVPDEVASHLRKQFRRGRKLEKEWQAKFDAYATANPALAVEWKQMQHRELPAGWDKDIPTFPADPKGLATRESSSKVLNAVAKNVPWLLGGAADLAPSTKTLIANAANFEKGSYSGRNFHFGVREHAMAGIVNGMVLSKLRAYGAGFLIFSDYARGSIRLGGGHGVAGASHFYARQHRRRRRRADASTRRAAHVTARHPAYDRHPSRRRQRSGRSLAGDDGGEETPHRARPDPASGPDPRPRKVRAGLRPAAGRVHPQRLPGTTGHHPHRHRLGGAVVRRSRRKTEDGRRKSARGQHAVMRVV